MSEDNPLDTKTKILDAAERLIIQLGPEKASLRKITEEAGVNVAAINYHFGSKNNMLSAIMARLLNPTVDELLHGLERLMADAAPDLPPLEAIIRCHLVPMLDFSFYHPDYESMFSRLHVSYDDENIFRNQIRQITEKTTKYYGECLIKVLPHIPEETVLRRLAVFKNTATGIMYGDRIMEESLAVLALDGNRQVLLEEMVRFAAAGFRA
ncbi:MAG: TetR/AcrR family transcriptional regulator [Desulfamplus sp.]|nr:TetR/AcrR family transcriptional regulator [Desulfamplus sp.]MBF0412838.1 TetR/AcrR family transcriptional regulator [Desulfamplus sp.]